MAWRIKTDSAFSCGCGVYAKKIGCCARNPLFPSSVRCDNCLLPFFFPAASSDRRHYGLHHCACNGKKNRISVCTIETARV